MSSSAKADDKKPDNETSAKHALEALVELQKSVQKTKNMTGGLKLSLDSLKKKIEDEKKSSETSSFTQSAQTVVAIAQTVAIGIESFTSGDAIGVATGALDMMGAITTAIGGPVGPLLGGIFSLISSILSLAGGSKNESLADIVDKVIRDALEDFRDQDLYENFIGSVKHMKAVITELQGMAAVNGGKVSDDSEKTFLTDLDFTDVGTEILGHLQGQIEQRCAVKYDDPKRAARIAKYVYQYCIISIQKKIILATRCSLLKLNGMHSLFEGASKYLNEVMVNDDKKVLCFLEKLPVKSDWYMVYYHLHASLNPQQRSIISSYQNYIGLDRMPGELCYLMNSSSKKVLTPTYNGATSEIRPYIAEDLSDARYKCLFRFIVPNTDNVNRSGQIFSVAYSEYLYTAPFPPLFYNRVISARSGEPIPNRSDWNIDGHLFHSAKWGDYYTVDRDVYNWQYGKKLYMYQVDAAGKYVAIKEEMGKFTNEYWQQSSPSFEKLDFSKI